MSFDARQNLYIPRISAAQVKDAEAMAAWCNLVADRLNALKAPRFIVRRLQDVRANVTVRVDDVGFVVGGVVLAGVWHQGGAPTIAAGDNQPRLDRLALQQGNASFILWHDSFANPPEALYSLTVVLFELDANNQQAAGNQSAFHKLLSGRV